MYHSLWALKGLSLEFRAQIYLEIFITRYGSADITASTVRSNPHLALRNGYGFSIPRGYVPIVISNDCYPRQEGVGCKGWGHTEVATQREYDSKACVKLSLLWLDVITCFAAGEERSIVAHSGSFTGEHKMKAK